MKVESQEVESNLTFVIFMLAANICVIKQISVQSVSFNKKYFFSIFQNPIGLVREVVMAKYFNTEHRHPFSYDQVSCDCFAPRLPRHCSGLSLGCPRDIPAVPQPIRQSRPVRGHRPPGDHQWHHALLPPLPYEDQQAAQVGREMDEPVHTDSPSLGGELCG